MRRVSIAFEHQLRFARALAGSQASVTVQHCTAGGLGDLLLTIPVALGELPDVRAADNGWNLRPTEEELFSCRNQLIAVGGELREI